MSVFHRRNIAIAIATLLSLSACGQSEEAPAQKAATATSSNVATANTASIVAMVNGKAITQTDYDKLAADNSSKSLSREQLIDDLVMRELIMQDGISKHVDKDQKLIDDVEKVRRQLIINNTVKKQIEDNPVTDAELQTEYDSQLASFKVQEYKARHILVETEDDAKAIIAELDKGADFAELAIAKSTGPSGKNGGDLGWFGEGQMVEPFANAVVAMEKGSYSKEPVQTQFGWHVILKEDERSATPPTLDEVKDQLQQIIVQQRISTYLDSLKSKATIEIK